MTENTKQADDDTTVRRSVTVRRPLADVKHLWDASIEGIPTFKEAPGGRGTEIHVEAPKKTQSALREIVGAYMSDDSGDSLNASLRAFKARLETGEVPTVKGQPSGREALD
jgi:hypothetical protein